VDVCLPKPLEMCVIGNLLEAETMNNCETGIRQRVARTRNDAAGA
jgi:hypothetical protein